MGLVKTLHWYTPEENTPEKREHLILHIRTSDFESYYYQSGFYENGEWFKINNTGYDKICEFEHVDRWCYAKN